MNEFPTTGTILINKPAGWTSFDAVNFIRKKIRAADPQNKKLRVGHAGTLDPFATGLLIIAIGREATKKIDEFKKLTKTYQATLFLGATSNTQDCTGQITTLKVTPPDSEQIVITLNQFTGKQLQTPPMFSAKKVNGQRLYKLARQGKEVERAPCEIEIYSIKLLEYNWPILKIEVQCSSGTYIRTLAQDIGERLQTGAYCEALTRTAIGEYSLTDAQNLAKTE